MATQFYTTSISSDYLVKALGEFLQPFVGTAPIVQGQTNRVPLPAENCAVITPVLQSNLSTAHEKYDQATDSVTVMTPGRHDIQIDFYGTKAGDWCRAFVNVFRSHNSPSRFIDGVSPLYCGDGIQAPLITGEQQWESRWTVTASLQVNADVIVPQEFFDEAQVNTFVAELTQ